MPAPSWPLCAVGDEMWKEGREEGDDEEEECEVTEVGDGGGGDGAAVIAQRERLVTCCYESGRD